MSRFSLKGQPRAVQVFVAAGVAANIVFFGALVYATWVRSSLPFGANAADMARAVGSVEMALRFQHYAFYAIILAVVGLATVLATAKPRGG